ncbi:hypothetical protein Ddc_22751 [Ditylenchus destructor]|nr:hypothetical protein Ddc_22751 [Ditylenchus destructor]
MTPPPFVALIHQVPELKCSDFYRGGLWDRLQDGATALSTRGASRGVNLPKDMKLSRPGIRFGSLDLFQRKASVARVYTRGYTQTPVHQRETTFLSCE